MRLPLAGLRLGRRGGARPGGIAQAGLKWLEQVFLYRDEFVRVIIGQVVPRPHRDGVVGTRLLAHPAVDTAQQVDLIALGVALSGRDPAFGRILRRLDHDATDRAGYGAELTTAALFQAVRVPMQDMAAAAAGRHDRLPLWVLDGDTRPGILPERCAQGPDACERPFLH